MSKEQVNRQEVVEKIATKRCLHCGEYKTLNKFIKYKEGDKSRNHNYCLACRRNKTKRIIREKQIYYDTPKGKYRSLYTRAKRIDREISFTLEEFLDWYKDRPLVCFYCGIPVRERGKTADSFTFDRADNDKPYTLDNIRIACRRCNTAKGSWFTEEQMLQIAGFYFGGSNKKLCIKAERDREWIDRPQEVGYYWVAPFCDGKYPIRRVVELLGSFSDGHYKIKDGSEYIELELYLAEYYPKSKWVYIPEPELPKMEAL